MNALWPLAGLVLGLEVVVLFHLLGHFLVARILRVPSELRLGFGPALPGCRFSRGGDTYVVAWFPLGGYIKVPMPATPDGEIPPIWKRALVACGGVIANVLLTWLCFTIGLSHGTERIAAVIGNVETGSPAWVKGIPSGAVIHQIGDVENPFFDDVLTYVVTSTPNEKLRIGYAVPNGKERATAEITLPFSLTQQRPMLGITPSSIPRLMSKRFARDLARPVQPNSAADRAEPPFEFDDVIVGVTDPDNLGRIEPLPEDPRNPGSGNGDFFTWTHRLRRLAGKDITVQVQRSDGREDKIRLPPAFYVTLPVRMEMGAIAAVRAGSPCEKMMLLPADDPRRPMDGDRILTIEVDEPDGSKTVFAQGKLDPLRLPFQLRLWSWRMAKAGKGDARFVTLTAQREQPDANPPWVQIAARLPWDATWEDQHDMTSKADAPLSIPELGLAYYVTNRVVAVDAPAAAQANGLRPGDLIEGIRFPNGGSRVKIDHEWAAMFAKLQSAPSREIVAEVLRDQLHVDVVLKTEEDLTWPHEERGLIFAPDTRFTKADNALEAASEGWQQIGTVIGQLWGVLSGRIRTQHLGGPVAVVSYSIADYDWLLFIRLLGAISLNFCWINLFPIPIVDGGELILLAVEKFTGRPLRPTTRWISYTVGGAFLAAWILCAVAVALMPRL